jgi:hypothetical protein
MQIGPGIVHFNFKTPLGPVYAIQTVTPLEPLLQRVTHFMFSSPWVRAVHDVITIVLVHVLKPRLSVYSRHVWESKASSVRWWSSTSGML